MDSSSIACLWYCYLADGRAVLQCGARMGAARAEVSAVPHSVWWIWRCGGAKLSLTGCTNPLSSGRRLVDRRRTLRWLATAANAPSLLSTGPPSPVPAAPAAAALPPRSVTGSRPRRARSPPPPPSTRRRRPRPPPRFPLQSPRQLPRQRHRAHCRRRCRCCPRHRGAAAPSA